MLDLWYNSNITEIFYAEGEDDVEYKIRVRQQNLWNVAFNYVQHMRRLSNTSWEQLISPDYNPDWRYPFDNLNSTYTLLRDGFVIYADLTRDLRNNFLSILEIMLIVSGGVLFGN